MKREKDKTAAATQGIRPAQRTRQRNGWLPAASRAGAAWLLAGVFLWSGTAKAFDPLGFTQAVERFRLIHGTLAQAIAYYLPWLEIALAVALVTRRWRWVAAWLSASLLLGFTSVLASAHWRGLNPACGCFGGLSPAQAVAYEWLYLRNAGLLALVTTLLISLPRDEKQKNWNHGFQ
jgi:uncharacterized membrane protein YphA (DoxX/SURF4 family)